MIDKRSKEDSYFDEEGFNDDLFNDENDSESDEDDNNLNEYNEGFKRFIYDKNKAKRRKEQADIIAEAKKIKQRRAKRKAFFKKTRSSILNYVGKCFEPSVLVFIGSSYFVYQRLELMNQQQQQQKAEIMQYIDQYVEKPPVEKSPTIGKMIRRNWPRIVIGSGVILGPTGKYLYNHIQESRQVRTQLKDVTKEFNTYRESSQEERERLEADKKKLEASTQEKEKNIEVLTTNLTITQGELNKTVELSKQQSENHAKNITEIKKSNSIKISKLHETLNRLNKFALSSAKAENELRLKLAEKTKHLAEVITQRDQLNNEIKHFKDNDIEAITQARDLKVQLKKLEEQLETKETRMNTLNKYLAEEKNKHSFFKLESSGLKSELNSVKSQRDYLIQQTADKTRQLVKIQAEQQNLNEKYQEALKQQNKFKEDIHKLTDETLTYQKSLEEANNKTNAFAVQMDEINNQLSQYKEYFEQGQKTITEQEALISRKEQDINRVTENNNKLKEALANSQAELQQTIINNEIYKSEKNRLDDLLKNAGRAEKQKLQKEMKKVENQLREVEKENTQLKKSIRDQSNQVAEGIKKQEGLIREFNELTTKSNNQASQIKNQEKYFLYRLQAERKRQEQKYNQMTSTAQQLVNELLNQQEQDQELKWWQKINVFAQSNISLNKESHEVIQDRESIFYPSLENQALFPSKVSERYDSQSDKWRIKTKEEQEKDNNQIQLINKEDDSKSKDKTPSKIATEFNKFKKHIPLLK